MSGAHNPLLLSRSNCRLSRRQSAQPVVVGVWRGCLVRECAAKCADRVSRFTDARAKSRYSSPPFKPHKRQTCLLLRFFDRGEQDAIHGHKGISPAPPNRFRRSSASPARHLEFLHSFGFRTSDLQPSLKMKIGGKLNQPNQFRCR